MQHQSRAGLHLFARSTFYAIGLIGTVEPLPRHARAVAGASDASRMEVREITRLRTVVTRFEPAFLARTATAHDFEASHRCGAMKRCAGETAERRSLSSRRE
jgi:hypothetical protein